MPKLNQLAINDEGFVFDPITGESYTVNSSGLVILNGLKASYPQEQIIDLLINDFEVTHEHAERDILDFMDHLKSFKLV
ncbi:MAG: PqqD family protein [SAR324 cluster bacterium]|nr:PqqD family protein [SAR324 cluster bacterium]MBF0349735.1 PqqD family protein [SAR324 cluster bacterium]